MMTLSYLLKQHNPALAGDAIKSHALSYFHIFNKRQDNIRATPDTDCSAIAGMNRITICSEAMAEVMPITPASDTDMDIGCIRPMGPSLPLLLARAATW